MSAPGIRTKWLLLLALAVAVVGAVDVYYEDNADLEHGDQLSQWDNVLDAEYLHRPDSNLVPDRSADLPPHLQYQYQQLAYPHTDKLSTFPYRSTWFNPGLELPKRTAAAALSNGVAGKPTVVPNKARVPRVKPQPKWKIKKGAHMICYFKLCSFRVYPTL